MITGFKLTSESYDVNIFFLIADGMFFIFGSRDVDVNFLTLLIDRPVICLIFMLNIVLSLYVLVEWTRFISILHIFGKRSQHEQMRNPHHKETMIYFWSFLILNS